MPDLPDRDQVQGKLKHGAGAVQATAGRATGNRELEAEGLARKDEGKAQETVGKAINAVGDTATKVKHTLGG